MDAEFIKWLVGQGGVVAVAALSLWMLKDSYERRIEESKTRRTEEREDKLCLAEVIKDNTFVMAQVRDRLPRKESNAGG